MKFLWQILFFGLLACTSAASEGIPRNPKATARVYQEGDIIFQTSSSPQCEAIKQATHSEWSHCGILFLVDGEWMVVEAVQPVTATPVDKWIKRGDAHRYAIMRHREAGEILTREVLEKMKKLATSFIGRDYDIYFNWSDEQIYCSELVYKIYERAAGIRVGEMKTLGQHDLSSKLVQAIMQQRYGSDIPLEEPMISPGAIYESPELMVVAQE